jgi:hypothetical protein
MESHVVNDNSNSLNTFMLFHHASIRLLDPVTLRYSHGLRAIHGEGRMHRLVP